MKVKEYEQTISELINLIDEGIYIVDGKGKGLFYSEKMSDMEKIDITDVIGKEFHKAFPGVPIDESTMYKALKKDEATMHKQQTYKNLYGKEITTINSTVPVKVDGEVVAAIEVAKDITNLQSMSNTILELQEGKINSNKTKKPSIKKYRFEDIIGENKQFKEVIMRAKKAANNDASVFIYGETGTGKELVAQSIHFEGKRKDRPFLGQNCAAIPETLLEGILFGTVKGGFTGAVDRAGLFEQANGGTLLLDEISAMPYDLQSKLLRVLQEDYIRRVGGTKDIPIDVRIIATVNEEPEKLITKGLLRKDLYFRLNIVDIDIPALRERKDDIPILADKFLEKHNEKFDKKLWMISDSAIKTLKAYDYPGNVRELENIIMQSVSMAENEHVLGEKILQMPQKNRIVGKLIEAKEMLGSLDEYLSDIEKELIRQAMIANVGNVTRAAQELKIKRQTLQHKLKKYGIQG